MTLVPVKTVKLEKKISVLSELKKKSSVENEERKIKPTFTCIPMPICHIFL